MIQTGGLPSAPVLSLWTAVSKYNYLQAMEVCGLQDVFVSGLYIAVKNAIMLNPAQII